MPTDRYQAHFAARQMRADGARRVVVASTADSYGPELSYNFVAAFTKHGGKVFDAEAAPGTALDPTAVVGAVKAYKADGVFLATNNIAMAASGSCDCELFQSTM